MRCIPILGVLVLVFSGYLCPAQVQESQTVYCVASNDSSTNSTCRTLREYMRNSSSYFRNDTTFLFQPGEHLTDSNTSLQVRNISRLTVKGLDATIQCNHQTNVFRFDHVVDLVIQDLHFVHCGGSPSNQTAGSPTLWVTNGTDIKLHNVTIKESDYQGILFDDVFGKILIDYSKIEKCNLSRYNESGKDPANVIYFSYCGYNASLVVTNTSLTNNSNFGTEHFLPYDNKIYPFAAGLTVVIRCPNIAVLFDNITADGNHGGDGGNIAFIFHTPELFSVLPVIVGNSTITNGRAIQGGGIFVSVVQPITDDHEIKPTFGFENHTILSIRNSHFENNSALFLGGAISIRQKESTTPIYTGSIHIHNCTFTSNSLKNAGHGGTAINSLNYIVTETARHITPQFKTFVTNCSFYKNYIQKNKRKSAGSSVIFVKCNPHFQLQDIIVDSNNSSAILGLQSNLVLGGNITLSNNSAESGGGILLCQNAVLYLEDGLFMLIADNHAKHAGGGIAVEAICVVSKPICFFQLASPDSNDYSNIHIHIHNNNASHAGHNLYGGSVDFCSIIESSTHDSPANHSLPVFQEIFDIYPKPGPGLPSVTSPPDHACICTNGQPDCLVTEYTLNNSVYPGEKFEIELILAGQLNGSVPGFLEAKVDSPNISIHEGEDAKKLRKAVCQSSKFRIKSPLTDISVVIDIGAAQQGDTSVTEYLQQYRQLKVNVLISGCPKGFVLNNNYVTCGCEPIIDKARAICFKHNHTIAVLQNTWIGSDQKEHYLITNYCPVAYCKPGVTYINTSLTEFNQDSQCLSNRQGIMCGQCTSNHSVMFGWGDCGKCSSVWLSTIPLYFVGGIFLVFVLTFFDITVAEGTINGFIFYANVVEANYHDFFIPKFKHDWFANLLSVFVGWLSLDTGVDKCFYNGMTAFHSAWIQFAFPFYIWLILGVIALLSRRYATVTRLIGRNTVKVFATTILLSYSKLTRAIIDGLDSTTVFVSNNTTYLVWTKDGNIPFLSGQHIALFAFCLGVLIVCVPFTASLLFIQPLERYSHKSIFCYVRKLKPFFDAYTGPHTDNARFWPGFLLLIRALVFITATFRGRIYLGANLSIAIALIFIVLSTAFFVCKGVYRKRSIQILEGTLLLNLALLFLFTEYIQIHDRSQQNQEFTTYSFIGIALLMFLGVLLYYVLRKIYSVRRIRECVISAKERVTRRFQYERIPSREDSNENADRVATFMPAIARFTEDREPLLADSNS